MANLTEEFSGAATEEQDGGKPVAPVFNRSATEKDTMTTEAAIELPMESPILETARIMAPRENASDEAFAAIKRGDAYRLKELLNTGLDVDTRDEKGFTLLMRAADEGQTEMAQELLLRKADPNACCD